MTDAEAERFVDMLIARHGGDARAALAHVERVWRERLAGRKLDPCPGYNGCAPVTTVDGVACRRCGGSFE